MTDELTQNPKLLAWAEPIQKNRDFTGGEWPVKRAGELYMPYPADGMSYDAYKKFLKRVGFFPAAARVHDGCVSLIFNRDPVLESENVEQIKDRITLKGDSLETFAEHIVSEVLITNYCGILVDHPDDSQKPSNANKKNAIDLGWHPFLAAYPFESIIDFDYGYVPALGHQAFKWVKLRDNENQYRRLELLNE